MMGLLERLSVVLGEVVSEDGALTVRHDGTTASLRVVPVADDLELISLSQLLVWDMPVDKRIRAMVTELTHSTMLGTIVMMEAKRLGEVLLRYNFPGTGLSDDALRTFILLVLSTGADVRRALMGAGS
jgi:hypothetical protein